MLSSLLAIGVIVYLIYIFVNVIKINNKRKKILKLLEDF